MKSINGEIVHNSRAYMSPPQSNILSVSIPQVTGLIMTHLEDEAPPMKIVKVHAI